MTAMLTTLRKRTRLIMIIVAVGFIGGFLLGGTLCQVIQSRVSGEENRFLAKGIIGQVGDHKITTNEYRNAVAYTTDKYREENQLRDLTNEDYAQIETRAWSFLISEITWGKLLQRCKVQISEQEIIEIMKANPPEELRTNPELLDSAGNFDQDKYLEVMNNPQNQAYFANYFRELAQMLPKEKFRIDVVNSYRVPGPEIAEALLVTNGQWKVTSLYFGPRLLTEKVEPTEEEVLAYYKAHLKDFRTRETRQLRYVKFPLAVSSEDSAEAEETIQRAFSQLEAGEEFNLTMLDYSDLKADTTSAFFLRERLDKATDTVISKLEPGRHSKPFLTDYGWQIVILDSVRQDSLALRRILVRVKMDAEAAAAVRDAVRDFIERTKEEDFDSVATNTDLTVMRARPMVDQKPNLAGLNLSSPSQLVNWAKQARQGQVMDAPVRGPDGFYVFELSELKPAETQEFEQAKDPASWRVRQEKEKQVWLAQANQVADEIRAGKNLEQYAAENENVELTSEEFSGLFDCRRRKGPEFAGTVLALEPGQTSGAIETNWGAFIIRCDSRQEAGTMTTQTFLQQRQQQIAQEVMQGLLKEPEIKDYRDPFGY